MQHTSEEDSEKGKKGPGQPGMSAFNTRAGLQPFITGMDRSRIMRSGLSARAF